MKINIKEHIGDKDFYIKMAKFAIPISIQQLITVSINLVDTIMRSSMGDAQLSASTLAGQFISLFQILESAWGLRINHKILDMKDQHSLHWQLSLCLESLCACIRVKKQLPTMKLDNPYLLLYGIKKRWSDPYSSALFNYYFFHQHFLQLDIYLWTISSQ